MSIRIMTQVWDTNLTDSLKIVLLALADCADDDGRCWPSIETLRCKTSKKSRRTVQMAIARLVELGHIGRREVPGRGNIYSIHPRNDCTPATVAPVQSAPKRGATVAGGCATIAPKPSNNHQEPSGGVRAGATPTPPPVEWDDGKKAGKIQRLPDDWEIPPVVDLPPAARRLVEQWPVGAYEAQAEAFRLHWTAEQGARARKSDWRAALGKWMIGDHARVMRDARAGVSWEVLAPAPTGMASRPVMTPSPAKRREEGRSFTLHGALRRELGEPIYETWIEPAALLVSDGGVQVVTASTFHREWIESRFSERLRSAVGDLLGGRPWVSFDVQPVRRDGSPSHG